MCRPQDRVDLLLARPLACKELTLLTNVAKLHAALAPDRYRRWMLRYPAAEAADELLALKLARTSNREVYVPLLGMGIRTIVVRPGYPHGAVSE
jgi:hypothetical protein